MTTRQLPHDAYITAVVDALTTAGLEPTEAWTEDTELDRYRDDDLQGVACMLTAVLVWDGDHPELTSARCRHGIALVWEHPAEQWLWAPQMAHGRLEREPEFLPTLGRYADPAAVVAVVRALLAGESIPDGRAPYWHEADAVKRAVDAWAAAETSE
jgi:hypothetical protein